MSPDDLYVNLVAGNMTGAPAAYAGYAYSWSGDVHFTSTGSLSNSGGLGLALNGLNVVAQSGTVSVTNAIPGAFVTSIHATAGSVNFTGGITTSDGGHGIGTRAVGGDNVTNTGEITIGGMHGWGLAAGTVASNGSCGTNTVNFTGNVTAPGMAALALGCGDTVVNVEAGQTARITNGDGVTIANLASGVATTNIAGSVESATLSGLALMTSGTLSSTTIFAGGQLVGRIEDYTDQENVLQLHSGGTWSSAGTSDFGAGIDVIDNEGRISTSGATGFIGLETLHNSGTIDMQNGAAGDVLSIEGDYVGLGSAKLLVDARNDQADQFIIAGNASGTTTIIVDSDGVVDPSGFTIVQAGSMTPGAFVLENPSATKLISHHLLAEGGELKVVSLANPIAYQPLVFGSLLGDLWNRSAEVSLEQAARTHSSAGRVQKVDVWGQFFGGSQRSAFSGLTGVFGGSQLVNGKLNSDQRGAMLGMGIRPAGPRLSVGVFGGYQNAKAAQSSLSGDVRAKGISIGAYTHFGGDVGPFGSLLLKHDWSKIRLTNDAFSDLAGNPRARTWGGAASGGFRWHGRELDVEIGSGLSYARSNLDNFTAEGVAYNFRTARSLRGHVEANIGLSKSLAPFVNAKVFHEFLNGNSVRMISGSVTDEVRGSGKQTWARIAAGFGGTANMPVIMGWLELGDRKGLGLTAGVRF